VSLRPVLLLAVLFSVVLSSTADGATRRIGPGTSFASAYAAANAGDVIEVGPGSYPRQEIPDASKAVTFRGLAGHKIHQLINNASNLTFDGLNVDAGGTTTTWAVFENHAPNVTFKNGRIGNVVDEKGAMLGGWDSTASMHVVFDNVEFHDVRQVGDGVHNECVYSMVPGITIRNSTFRNCATMDLMITRGDWWGQPTYGGVTLENNVFAHSTNGSDPRWHYYGFLVHGNMGQLKDARIVNNTFETPVGGVTTDDVDSASGIWANNIGGGWDCLPGMTYRGNVGKQCHSSDVQLGPVSCAPPTCSPAKTMPVGWLNPGRFDFRLAASSPAIGVADPAYAPRTDRRGWARDSRPDAGAFEYGASGPPGSGPTGTNPSASWRLAFAKLTKGKICHNPRRGCPGSTKLRLGLGRPAAVTVRLDRLRKGGKKAKRAARIKRLGKVKLHRATRIRAHGLRKGRYRVTVRAKDGSGLRSAPLRLKLRVR
jgi:hypothetical protein